MTGTEVVVVGLLLPTVMADSVSTVMCSCLSSRPPLVPSKYSMTVMMFVMMLSFYYFSRHVSATHLSSCLPPSCPRTLEQFLHLPWLMASPTSAGPCFLPHPPPGWAHVP